MRRVTYIMFPIYLFRTFDLCIIYLCISILLYPWLAAWDVKAKRMGERVYIFFQNKELLIYESKKQNLCSLVCLYILKQQIIHTFKSKMKG